MPTTEQQPLAFMALQEIFYWFILLFGLLFVFFCGELRFYGEHLSASGGFLATLYCCLFFRLSPTLFYSLNMLPIFVIE